MRRIKKFICYIFGHKFNEIPWQNNAFECLRCDIYSYDYPVKEEEFYAWRQKFIHKRTWKIKEKIRKIKWKIQDFFLGDDGLPF